MRLFVSNPWNIIFTSSANHVDVQGWLFSEAHPVHAGKLLDPTRLIETICKEYLENN